MTESLALIPLHLFNFFAIIITMGLVLCVLAVLLRARRESESDKRPREVDYYANVQQQQCDEPGLGMHDSTVRFSYMGTGDARADARNC